MSTDLRPSTAPDVDGLLLRRPEHGLVHLPHLVTALYPDGTAEPVSGPRHSVDGADGAILTGASASFHATASIRGVPLHPDVPRQWPVTRLAVKLTVRCVADEPVTAGLRVEARLGAGAAHDPGWLVPGVFYGSNRLPACTRRYPAFVAGEPDPDPAAFEADAWSFRADRAATPAVFAWDPRGGAALVTSERGPLGQSGVGFALVDGVPAIRLHFPYREEPVVYDGSARPRPAQTTYTTWAPGQRVELDFDVYLLGPQRHGYTAVLRDVHARTADDGTGTVAWVDVAQAAELAAWGLYRWHYRPDPPILLETAAFDRDGVGRAGDRPAMHVSWVSGIPYAYALLRHGRRRGWAEYVDAALRVVDHIVDNLAPAGLFWGQWTESRGWHVGWTPDQRRLHARTLGDATLFLLRAYVAERAAGYEHPSWAAAVRSNLDVARAGARADGALGSAYDAHTGEVIDRAGTAGLAWIPALVEAATAFDEPEYLAVARAAGRHHLADVHDEFLCGAPEDVDLAPTSEDGYLAVMAYVLLHEHDGADPAWLDAARRAADWMLTFRYTYDVDFPPHTLLGMYDFRTRGADQASPANQHLHSFGLICAPELERLAGYLDDPYYRRSHQENLDCFRQFVAREDGDFNAQRGMVSERFYQTACFQAKGMLGTLSHAWCVGVLLYACEDAIGRGTA